MTRRSFLRVLSTTVAGVALAPYVPPLEPVSVLPVPWFAKKYYSVSVPIRYADLERIYQSCVVGEFPPTMCVVHQSVARKLGLIFDVESA